MHQPNQSPFGSTSPAILAALGLPMGGYCLTREQFRERIEGNPRYLDSVGRLQFVGDDLAVVTPASELPFAGQSAGIQITELVIGRKGEIKLNATGRAPRAWIEAIARINFSASVDPSTGHYEKAFEPGYQGPITSTICVIGEDGTLRAAEICAVDRNAITGCDAVFKNGKTMLAATTVDGQVFEALLDNAMLGMDEAYEADFTEAAWALGRKLTQVRGCLDARGEVLYMAVDIDNRNGITALRGSDRKATVAIQQVEGCFRPTTGGYAAQGHVATVLIGNKLQAVRTNGQPGRVEIDEIDLDDAGRARLNNARRGSRLLTGLQGPAGLFAQGNNPFAQIAIVDLPTPRRLSASAAQ